MYIYIYIYTYRERERERMHTSTLVKTFQAGSSATRSGCSTSAPTTSSSASAWSPRDDVDPLPFVCLFVCLSLVRWERIACKARIVYHSVRP